MNKVIPQGPLSKADHLEMLKRAVAQTRGQNTPSGERKRERAKASRSTSA
jgi:hypothetical protein